MHLLTQKRSCFSIVCTNQMLVTADFQISLPIVPHLHLFFRSLQSHNALSTGDNSLSIPQEQYLWYFFSFGQFPNLGLIDNLKNGSFYKLHSHVCLLITFSYILAVLILCFKIPRYIYIYIYIYIVSPKNKYIFNNWFSDGTFGCCLGWVGFYGISTIVGYLMPNPLYTYILNIWFGLVGFYGISTIVGIQCQILFIHIYKIYRIWFRRVLWHINHCGLFNAKSSSYIYIKYIGFGLVGFYGISTIVGYLMPNPLYTYIINIYDLDWSGFMEYQRL